VYSVDHVCKISKTLLTRMMTMQHLYHCSRKKPALKSQQKSPKFLHYPTCHCHLYSRRLAPSLRGNPASLSAVSPVSTLYRDEFICRDWHNGMLELFCSLVLEQPESPYQGNLPFGAVKELVSSCLSDIPPQTCFMAPHNLAYSPR
jgi:hypothetical protein